MDEGAWPRDELVFVEPKALSSMGFVARFPALEPSSLDNFKHVRKLLLAVENSNRKLVSDGVSIAGIAEGQMPEICISADFRVGHGFLKISDRPVSVIQDGVELNAQCLWKPLSTCSILPPTLGEWVAAEDG
jgi:hypothetical protein